MKQYCQSPMPIKLGTSCAHVTRVGGKPERGCCACKPFWTFPEDLKYLKYSLCMESFNSKHTSLTTGHAHQGIAQASKALIAEELPRLEDTLKRFPG